MDGIEREELGGGTRQSIFTVLLEEGDPMSPSEIGGEIDEPRQQVHYHLDKLLRMGLVVSDDGKYRVQPMFLDPEYERLVLTALSSIVPIAREFVEIDDDLDSAAEETVISNCVRLSVAMHVR